MTAAIIVHISPDADGVRCGECFACCGPRGYRVWAIWASSDGFGEYHRGPECHRRGKLLADLREAGNVLREQDAMRGTAHNRWDAAIDAIKGEKP